MTRPTYRYDAHGGVPQFTGKERDTETGLDYFGARYYGNSRCPTFAERSVAKVGVAKY